MVLHSGASRGKYQHFDNSDSRICTVGRLYCVLRVRQRRRRGEGCGGHHRAGAQHLNVAENPTGACYRVSVGVQFVCICN
eukprot:gene14283-biopygen8083